MFGSWFAYFGSFMACTAIVLGRSNYVDWVKDAPLHDFEKGWLGFWVGMAFCTVAILPFSLAVYPLPVLLLDRSKPSPASQARFACILGVLNFLACWALIAIANFFDELELGMLGVFLIVCWLMNGYLSWRRRPGTEYCDVPAPKKGPIS